MERLLLPTHDFYHFVDVDNIMYCQSNNSYTTFYICNEAPITVSQSIKVWEEMLAQCSFIRPHQSYLVNVKHVKSLQKTGENSLHISNGAVLPISVRKKKEILRYFHDIKRIQGKD